MRRPLRPTPTAPALLAFALLVAPGAAAATEDVAWRLEARSIALVQQGSGFTYSSSRSSGLGDDLLSGTFSADPPRLDARLDATAPEATVAALQVEWTELVEYRDADGDGRFGLADPVVQRIALADLPSSTVVTPVLGGRTAAIRYTLPANDSEAAPPLPVPAERGEFRLTFTLVAAPTSVSGRSVAPTELALGAAVQRFPYLAGDSRLALLSVVATSLSRLDHESDGVAVASGPLTFRLAWGTAASSDGVAFPAPATAVSTGAERAVLVQSWPRGTQVEQDGGVSAQRWSDAGAAVLDRLPPGDWRFFALGVAVVAIALGLPSLRRLRET